MERRTKLKPLLDKIFFNWTLKNVRCGRENVRVITVISESRNLASLSSRVGKVSRERVSRVDDKFGRGSAKERNGLNIW